MSKQLWLVLTFIPVTLLMLFFDSNVLIVHGITFGQIIPDILVPLYFGLLLCCAPRDLRVLMLLTVPISLLGEFLCSLFLKLYIYRYGMVPVYVPFGHAVVICTGFLLANLSWIRLNQRLIQTSLGTFYVLLFAGVILVLHDTLSLLFGGIFLWALHRKRWQPLYLLMGLVVLIVEVTGTSFGCWRWGSAPFSILHTTNPPAGAIVLYILGDLIVWRAARHLQQGLVWLRQQRLHPLINARIHSLPGPESEQQAALEVA